jgi:hypothetical protein
MPLAIQDLQPLDRVAELAPGAVSRAAGVVGLLVGEGEGLFEPAPIEVEVDQVAGQDAGRDRTVAVGPRCRGVAGSGFSAWSGLRTAARWRGCGRAIA